MGFKTKKLELRIKKTKLSKNLQAWENWLILNVALNIIWNKFLVALSILFTNVGVGDALSNMIYGVVACVLGIAVFTMIMDNVFAF